MFWLALVVGLVAGLSKRSVLAAIGGFVMTYVVTFLLISLGIITLATITV